jgi:Raf kinase inhibitor-like YbhB/YbcL family protein
MTLKLTSTAFAHGGEIASKYTCEGQDVSPPLAWSGVPTNGKSLVLIVDDPDAPDPAAPKMTWVHWVLYNIPTSVSSLAEAAKQLPAMADAARLPKLNAASAGNSAVRRGPSDPGPARA